MCVTNLSLWHKLILGHLLVDTKQHKIAKSEARNFCFLQVVTFEAAKESDAKKCKARIHFYFGKGINTDELIRTTFELKFIDLADL